jgi:hypothetical protein
MEDLPTELYDVILYFCSYRDMLRFGITAKHINNNINPVNVLYKKYNNRLIPDNIYAEYTVCSNNNIKFVVPKEEHIIYQGPANLGHMWDPGFIFVTINNNNKFIIYECNNYSKIWDNAENEGYDFDDWDDKDFDILRIHYRREINSMQEFKQLRMVLSDSCYNNGVTIVNAAKKQISTL